MMKITHDYIAARAEIPRGDALAEYAVSAYGFTLNTDERRNRPHSGPEFAEAIAETCDTSNPHTSAVCAHLRAI